MLYYKGAISYVDKKEDALNVILETAYNAFLAIRQFRIQCIFQHGYLKGWHPKNILSNLCTNHNTLCHASYH